MLASVVFRPTENHALLQKVSSFLHDARVIGSRWVPLDRRFSLRLKRAGYEHGFVQSDGFFGFGRRWMYPWVDCELELAPVASASEERRTFGTEDFDNFMSVRVDQQRMMIHREFSEVSIELLPESVLRLVDIGTEINPNEGLLVISRMPLDVSYIHELLETPVQNS